jgi:hypothetical protein
MNTEPLTRIAVASFQIGNERRPLSPQALTKSARRLKILQRDERGRLAIPTAMVPALRKLYRQAGVLAPRCKV